LRWRSCARVDSGQVPTWTNHPTAHRCVVRHVHPARASVQVLITRIVAWSVTALHRVVVLSSLCWALSKSGLDVCTHLLHRRLSHRGVHQNGADVVIERRSAVAPPTHRVAVGPADALWRAELCARAIQCALALLRGRWAGCWQQRWRR
jgi:hypothetical protein